MRRARAELGDDARLVSARRVSPPDAPPVYEVRVIAGGPGPAPAAADSLDALRREIESLRAALVPARPAAAVAEPAGAADSGPEDGLRAQWIELLRRRGTGAALAARLADRTLRLGSPDDDRDPLARLHATLAAELRDEEDEPVGERSTVLVGPSGAGKTSVLAKLATERVARGASPMLVTTDGESLSGEDEVEAVAAALGLPFRTAFLDGELAAIAAEAGDGRLLVDTPGRTPAGRDGLRSLAALRDALPHAEILPVLPATLDLEEARLLMDGYASAGAERAVLTKLDELSRPGRLLDLVRALDRPVAWVTFGRAARGAAEAPASPRVVERILGTVLALETQA
jgi:flagellar biosynthesis GTPase FlhF